METPDSWAYIASLLQSKICRPLKKETTLLLAIGAGVAGYYLFKGRAAGNLVFFPAGITSIEYQGGTPLIRFGLIVQNTNSISINLQSLAGNAFTDDAGSSTLLGNLSLNQPVHIPGNGQTMLEVTIRMRLISVITQIIAAWQQGTVRKNIQVDAFANVDGLQVPVKFSMAVGQ